MRGLFRKQRNFRFRQGSVLHIDWHAKTVLLNTGASVPFDYLIVAAGTTVNDFGVAGVKEHAHFLHDLDDAVRLRGHICGRLERLASDPTLRERGVLTFTVVGAARWGWSWRARSPSCSRPIATSSRP